MTPVNPSAAINGVGGLQNPAAKAGANGGQSKSFGDVVQQYLQQTNQNQLASQDAMMQLATGQTDNIQQVVTAVAKAEMSFQMFMEIRNHLVDAYNEMMRMQF